jgi:rhodanese-related sulfurtransferase
VNSRVNRPTRRFHFPSALRPSPFRIEPQEALELTAAGAVLIDVRRTDDPGAELPHAERVPPDMIPERVAGLRRDVAVVLACT